MEIRNEGNREADFEWSEACEVSEHHRKRGIEIRNNQEIIKSERDEPEHSSTL
jgi:hypothetical protein